MVEVKFQEFLATKVIQTNFRSKLPTTDDEELDASTKLGKAEKLLKIKIAMEWLCDSMFEQHGTVECKI